MTDHKNMYSISAFLAGAFIGASIALILAPQTGAQLRRAIRNSADKAREEFVEAWETAQEKGKEYAESGKAVVRRAGAAAESAMERGRGFLESGKPSAKDAGRDALEHGKEFLEASKTVARDAGRTLHKSRP